jgi:hypothetical protein
MIGNRINSARLEAEKVNHPTLSRESENLSKEV